MKIKTNDIYKLIIALFIASIPMMPIFTLTGFYVLGILVTVMFIMKTIKLRKMEKLSSFEIFYFLFIAWNSLSLYWSVTGEKSVIRYMLIYFTFTVSTIRLIFLIYPNKDEGIKFFGKCYISATILISIICLIVEHPFGVGSKRLGTYLFAGIYGTRMTYTYSLEVSIFMLLYFLMETKTKKKRIWYLVELLFITFCTLLTGTRKIILGVIVYILMYILIKNRKNFFKVFAKMLIIAVIIFVAYQVVMKVEVFYNILGQRLETALEFKNGDEDADASMRDRSAMVDYAILKFKERPIIGKGSNAFHKLFYAYYGQDLYAHNNFAELLCDVGIIGFLLYYMIYVCLILKKCDGKYKTMIVCSIFGILIMDYWNITYYRIHFLLFFEVASLYLNFKRSKYNQINE